MYIRYWSTDYTITTYEPLSPPLATSSPYKQRDNTKTKLYNTRLGKSKTDKIQKHTQEALTSTKRQSIKNMVINLCSITNKMSDLAVCIETYNPDIIFGTETHLNSSINSSELFPPNYSVIRKDGDFDNSKEGVLIALKSDLIGTHRTDLNSTNNLGHNQYTRNERHYQRCIL